MSASKLPLHYTGRDIRDMLKLLLPLIFMLCCIALYSDFIWESILGNKVVNSGIIIASCGNCLFIIVRMLSTQADLRALGRFREEALNGADMDALLKEPWLKNRPIHQYLEHIAQTRGKVASQLNQNAIENELQALTLDYNGKIKILQTLANNMISLGLLGTFVGLLETLTGISGMLNGIGGTGVDVEQQFSQLISELRKPLAGMGMAFSASMFGLVTCLMLSIMLLILKSYTERVLAKARDVMHVLTRIVVPQDPYDSLNTLSLASMRQMEPLQEDTRNIAEPGDDSEQFAYAEAQKKAFLDVMEDIRISISATGTASQKLFTKMERVAESIDSKIAGAAGNGSQITPEMFAPIMNSISAMQNDQKIFYESFSANWNGVQDRLAELTGNSHRSHEKITSVMLQVETALQNLHATARSPEDGPATNLPATMPAREIDNELRTLFEAQNKAQEKMGLLLSSLSDRINSEKETNEIGSQTQQQPHDIAGAFSTLSEIDHTLKTLLTTFGKQEVAEDKRTVTIRQMADGLKEMTIALQAVSMLPAAIGPVLDRNMGPIVKGINDSYISQKQAGSSLKDMASANRGMMESLFEIKQNIIDSGASFSRINEIAADIKNMTTAIEALTVEIQTSGKQANEGMQKGLKEFVTSLSKVMGVNVE